MDVTPLLVVEMLVARLPNSSSITPPPPPMKRAQQGQIEAKLFKKHGSGAQHSERRVDEGKLEDGSKNKIEAEVQETLVGRREKQKKNQLAEQATTEIVSLRGHRLLALVVSSTLRVALHGLPRNSIVFVEKCLRDRGTEQKNCRT